MAHMRKPSIKNGRTDENSLWSCESQSTSPTSKSQFEGCSTCKLVCFGILMAFTGSLVGMYFKSEIVDAYWSTAGHIGGRLSTIPFPQQSAMGIFGPRDGDLNEAEANAATEADAEILHASWAAKWVDKKVCDNSCSMAKDGVCNDGRSGRGQVYCDLGTDCSDCGSWTFHVPEDNQTVLQPVKMLLSHNVTLNTGRTATVPHFLMPYTDPAQDTDVSTQMHNDQVVELGLTQAWYKVLDEECVEKDGSRRLVLDVGANFGYYTFYAAAHGCRVVSWEPVPIFRAFLQYGLQLNNATWQVRVRDKVVSEKAGKKYELTVPSQGIWGTASVDGRNIDEWSVGTHRQIVKARSERVDALIHEDVLVLKLDVEGFEPSAFQSMKGLFDSHTVGNMFMEYSPGVYENKQLWAELPDMPRMLTYLLEHGYTILHIDDWLARGHSLLQQPHWAGDLPALDEITIDNLKHDLIDAKKLQSRILGCYAPLELVALNPAWNTCNSLPEDLHPKSFRSTFGHNTNIWASLAREKLVIGSAVGIQSLDQREAEWYGRDSEIGMGGRACSGLQPSNVLRHRCPCNQPGCKAEAKLIEQLNARGLMGRLSNRKGAEPPPAPADPRSARGDEEH